jgi:hypothetical protein
MVTRKWGFEPGLEPARWTGTEAAQLLLPVSCLLDDKDVIFFELHLPQVRSRNPSPSKELGNRGSN